MKKTIFIAAIMFAAGSVYAADATVSKLVKGAASSSIFDSIPLPVASEPVSTLPASQTTKAVKPHQPMSGTFTGNFGGEPVNLTYNRREGSLTGMLNGKPVNIKVNFDSNTLSGVANGADVSMSFNWSDQYSTESGMANGSDASFNIDWQSGTVTGTSTAAPVSINFNLEDGTIQGMAATGVNLSYNQTSGAISGSIGQHPMHLTATNINPADFFNFLFLFLKP